MCRIDKFWNIHETFPTFFSKQAKLRQPHRTETADFRFQISNFKIRQIAFLMTCRPHKSSIFSRRFFLRATQITVCMNTRAKSQFLKGCMILNLRLNKLKIYEREHSYMTSDVFRAFFNLPTYPHQILY